MVNCPKSYCMWCWFPYQSQKRSTQNSTPTLKLRLFRFTLFKLEINKRLEQNMEHFNFKIFIVSNNSMQGFSHDENQQKKSFKHTNMVAWGSYQQAHPIHIKKSNFRLNCVTKIKHCSSSLCILWRLIKVWTIQS